MGVHHQETVKIHLYRGTTTLLLVLDIQKYTFLESLNDLESHCQTHVTKFATIWLSESTKACSVRKKTFETGPLIFDRW